MAEPHVLTFHDSGALAYTVARYVEEAAASTTITGRFTIALAGGSTPRAAYRLFAEPPFVTSIPWERTHIFWGDERCVSPDNGESNYRMAFDAFIGRVPLAPGNVHRIMGEASPHVAVALYERQLDAVFGEGVLPAFDCILLGIGDDGHTASLFAGSEAFEERRKRVAYTFAPDGYTTRDRVTLTLPVIDNAERVAFLVSGEGKRHTVSRILSGRGGDLPAGRVSPRGELRWFMTDDVLHV